MTQAGLQDGSSRLSLRAVSKSFGPTKALDHVDLDVSGGEIHGLIGQNGSGKSTLVKILAGVYGAEPGAQAFFDGQPTDLAKLADTNGTRAVRFVHQDLGVIPEMSTIENVSLHVQGLSRSWGHRRRRAAETADVLDEYMERFSLSFDVEVPLTELTPLERTIVAIVVALQRFDSSRGLLVLDEPTSALGRREASTLLDLVRRLSSEGASVLLVSHRLDEVLATSDVVSVLRGGRRVATAQAKEVSGTDLVGLMVGSAVPVHDSKQSRSRSAERTPVLQVRGLAGKQLRKTDLILGPGEILGVAGLPGSGADELPRLLTDSRKRAGGSMSLDGGEWTAVARSSGDSIVLVPPDRSEEGLIQDMSVAENLSLSVLQRLSRLFWIDPAREGRFIAEWISRLNIVCGDPTDSVSNLSGGNQQRVLLGRAMAKAARVVALCEPTVGVDVITRYAIYELLLDYARDGVGLIVNSSDTTDLCAICDRVVVFRDGFLVAELRGADLTESTLGLAIEGFDASSQGDPRTSAESGSLASVE